MGIVFGKKAVSPFISIILIVGLAVIVAAIVMNWTTMFTEQTHERVSAEISKTVDCGVSVGLGVWRDVSGSQEICLNASSGNIVFLLENKERLNIADVSINAILKDNVVANQTGIQIPPGAVVSGKLKINATNTSVIRSVIFTPAMASGKDVVWCGDNKITVEGANIGNC